jgi:hypothetical protein
MQFDYLLLLDADMELSVHDPAFLRNLTSAAYHVRQRNRIVYRNIRLLRVDVRASYRGVTHEFLSVGSSEVCDLNDISILDHATGSNRTNKYERDIPLPTQALATERDPTMIARYVFYLANTLRDRGQRETVLPMYLRRASLGGWRQEVFLSLLNAAMLKEPSATLLGTFYPPTSARPRPAEVGRRRCMARLAFAGQRVSTNKAMLSRRKGSSWSGRAMRCSRRLGSMITGYATSWLSARTGPRGMLNARTPAINF